MTKTECLANVILAKEYMSGTDCLTYGYLGNRPICKQYFTISVSKVSRLKEKEQIDALIWNTMREHCNNCNYCDGGKLSAVKCVLSESDKRIHGFFVKDFPRSPN